MVADMAKYLELKNDSGDIILSDEYIPLTIKEKQRFRDGVHQLDLNSFKVIGCDGSAELFMAASSIGVSLYIKNSTADVVLYDATNESSAQGELVVYSDNGTPIYSNRDNHIAVYNSGLVIESGPIAVNSGPAATVYKTTNTNKKYISISPFYGVGMIDMTGHLAPSYRNIYFEGPSSLRYEQRYLGTQHAGETGGSGHQVFAGVYTPLYIFEQVF